MEPKRIRRRGKDPSLFIARHNSESEDMSLKIDLVLKELQSLKTILQDLNYTRPNKDSIAFAVGPKASRFFPLPWAGVVQLGTHAHIVIPHSKLETHAFLQFIRPSKIDKVKSARINGDNDVTKQLRTGTGTLAVSPARFVLNAKITLTVEWNDITRAKSEASYTFCTEEMYNQCVRHHALVYAYAV